jgi:uncharacterized protein (DUF362 family)
VQLALQRRVSCVGIGEDLRRAVKSALEGSGILARVTDTTRVAIKPNFTYPYYKPGVTTSPRVIRACVEEILERTSHVRIVETDGGYGLWTAKEAFAGHGVDILVRELGITVSNLCEESAEEITFRVGRRQHRLPLPSSLLHDTDLLISMPVPKIHAMTGLTLGYKNQWGCIPDTMRLRRHFVFDDAIVAINQALRPAVLGDGTWFLDRTGPMDGDPVRMDLVIGASDAGAFDRYVSEVMDVPWRRVGHLRRAEALGDMPSSLAEVQCNRPPADVRQRTFHLARTPRHWIALGGFRSRAVTWMGYESWFGRTILHGILYAVAGPPIRPQGSTDAGPGATK